MGAMAYADSTAVLPKGRSSVSLSYIQDRVLREFDASGADRELGYYLNKNNVTSIGEPFLNSELINQGLFVVFPSLTPPGGYLFDSLDLAKTYLDANVEAKGTIFSYNYGVTDKLTVGIGFPYLTRVHTDVDYGVEVIPSAAAFAETPAVPFPAPTLGHLILSLDSQELLNKFLNQVGYDDIEEWTGEPGIGDIRVGAKYRFLNEKMVKAAWGGWVDVPTGKVDDERNLTDVAYGGGSYNTAVYAMMDLTPVEAITLNLTGRYVYTFPYQRGKFVLDPDNPKFYKDEFATLHVNGDFDSGNWYELESELAMSPMPGVDFFTVYFYRQTESDRIDDDLIPKSIEKENRLGFGVTASSVPAYVDKRAKVPMSATMLYEPVQEGQSIEKTQRITLTMSLYF